MFRTSLLLRRCLRPSAFSPTRMLLAQSMLAVPLSQKKAGNADLSRLTLDKTFQSIPDAAMDILQKRLPQVGHAVVWEYFYQLAKKLMEIEDLNSKMEEDGTSPLGKYRNRDTTPFSLVKWNTIYSWEVDFATTIYKHIKLIEESLAASQQAASSGASEEEVEMLRDMAGEDISSAIDALTGEIATMEETIARRVDESDEWSKAATVWTLETLGRAGGTEAGIFAKDMLELYKKYLPERGWKVEDVSDPESHGGKLRLEGEGIYPVLKHEMGTHRVQRVPVTDQAGKMQTSTCSVMLMPQPSATSVDIKESDCKFDFVRGSGPGGQGMQSSSNCCVMTHIPSGFTCKVHQARSAAANKELALEMLAQKLWREKNVENEAYQNSLFEKQWTSGERGEKIRTYNFPQNRVTEHRIPTDVPLTSFMEGGQAMREVHDRLVEDDRRDALNSVLVKHIVGGFSSK